MLDYIIECYITPWTIECCLLKSNRKCAEFGSLAIFILGALMYVWKCITWNEISKVKVFRQVNFEYKTSCYKFSPKSITKLQLTEPFHENELLSEFMQ